ncbi:MAG: adenosine deaminase, partial [Parvularculaceae bacterium]
VIEGIVAAMADGESQLGMSSHLIMSFLRHLSEEDAFKTLDQAEPYLDHLLGVGLDSSELGHPPSKFERVFAAARARGLKCFAHGGEEGPPEYVWECLDLLKVDRLDHGNRSLEDDALVTRLASDEMVLTVCPLSNLKLCVVDDLTNHPIRKMLQKGLKATINSDDPSYFGGYLTDNYIETANALDLTIDELAQLARHSFEGAYMDEQRRTALLAEIAQSVTDLG